MKTTLFTSSALAVAAALALTACGGGGAPSSGQSANLSADAKNATCPGGEITFGIEPYEDPAKLKPAYDVLAAALSKKLDCPVSVQVVEDYAAEVLAMRNGKLDLGQFGPLGYVFADEKAGAEPLVSFGAAEKELSAYTAGILVAKDSPLQRIEDLKGKSLAVGSVGSTSGDVLPRFGLRGAGIADAGLKMDYTGGHPEALLALKNGKVEAGEINSHTLAMAVAAGTFRKDGFRRIWTSNPIPNDPITVRGDADPAFKKAVKDAFLSLDPTDVPRWANSWTSPLRARCSRSPRRTTRRCSSWLGP
ncbi:UNVERIFIED_ORG: phosphonate transport system substrate-binding protein [Arthrobacter sp. UYEF2]